MGVAGGAAPGAPDRAGAPLAQPATRAAMARAVRAEEAAVGAGLTPVGAGLAGVGAALAAVEAGLAVRRVADGQRAMERDPSAALDGAPGSAPERRPRGASRRARAPIAHDRPPRADIPLGPRAAAGPPRYGLGGPAGAPFAASSRARTDSASAAARRSASPFSNMDPTALSMSTKTP